MPPYFQLLIDPYDNEATVQEAEESFPKIKIPTYTGSGWYAYTYKTHLNGAQNYFERISAPKKLTFAGPAHLERPFHSLHGEILRWYDHWLKNIDTGIMDEPAVRYWVMGANEWRSGSDWPLPETQWTKFYLNSWERLQTAPFTPSSAEDELPPDAFVQMPPTQTNTVARLRYMTDPLPNDVLIAGPSVWRGWLKASHRALDPKRSKPWRPWHPLTRQAQRKVTPGEITEYSIEILATANLFRRGHRICVEIASADMPTGVAGATNAEYVPNHIVSSGTTLHKIFHDAKRPSHLLLPIIPQG